METISYGGLTFEHRAIGIFSAAEVRDIAPGLTYAVAVGCPLAIAEEVMRKNAAKRAGRPVVAATAPARHKFVPTEAQRNAVLDRVRRIRLANSIAMTEAQDRALAGLNPTVTLTDEQRRKRAEETAAKIYADDVAEFMKPKIFG